jgi:hypothetical protein
MGAVMQEISPHTPLTEPFMLCAAIPALGGGLTLAPPGIVAAHQLTWKFVYSSFIKADLLDEPFVSSHVINAINYRLRERLQGYIFRANLDTTLALGAGRPPREATYIAGEVEPLLDEDLNIKYSHLKPQHTTRTPTPPNPHTPA